MRETDAGTMVDCGIEEMPSEVAEYLLRNPDEAVYLVVGYAYQLALAVTGSEDRTAGDDEADARGALADKLYKRWLIAAAEQAKQD